MKMKFALLVLVAGCLAPVTGQGFVNLDFEGATVVSNDPFFGFLDWNLAAPGWSHSSGSDTSIIYYGHEHVGATQYYMLYSAVSPAAAPGTQLAGQYSLGFSSGYASSAPGAPWVQAYLAQTGLIASNARSIQFLARGNSFALFVGGIQVPLLSLGGNTYAGDISAFAGTTVEFRIVNTSLAVHDPVVVDGIVFSPTVVPEPSTLALFAALGGAWGIHRKVRRAKPAGPAAN